MQKDDAKLADFLRRLRWSLSPLPQLDIDDIVAETRSHVEDRIEAGASLDDALAGIGDPALYAGRFVREHSAAKAMSTRGANALVSALLANAAGNVLAIATLAVIFVMWAFVLLVCLVAVTKIFHPDTVGLWSGGDMFFLGIIDDPSTARELLGVWIFPLAFALLVFAILVTRRLALWALRRLVREG